MESLMYYSPQIRVKYHEKPTFHIYLKHFAQSRALRCEGSYGDHRV